MRPILFMAIILLGMVGAARVVADIPPDAGYKRVRTNIVLETKEGLPEFRFFLVSSNLVREISLKPGGKITVDPPGGGSRYRVGTVVAVPAKNLTQFGDDRNGEKKIELEDAISGDKVGAIKLIDHTFVRDLRESEARDVQDAAYRIERDGSGVRAVPLSAEPKKQSENGGVSFGIYDIGRTVTPIGWTMIAVGLILVVLTGTFGLWKFLGPLNKHK